MGTLTAPGRDAGPPARPGPDDTAGLDGRAARGARTRMALAEAMISLLEEGDESPTARRIAERAGVSLRLVFHHFEDLDAILQAAVLVQAERHWRHLEPLPPAQPLSRRVRTMVNQRTTLYESIAPVRRAALRMERSSPTVAKELERTRRLLASQLRKTFSPELEAFPSGKRQRVADAIEAATSFETWESFKRAGRSPTATRRAIELLLEAVLETRESRRQ